MESESQTIVAKAAGLLMASTILSRILGYSRDILIAAAYGQTRMTDAYLAAFSIPDFLYSLLVAGVVTAAFVPVFSGYINTDRRDEGWEVASTVYNIAGAAMLCGILTAWVLAPVIVRRWLVPGFEPEYMTLTVTMTRVMLFQAFFMALNGISTGIQNAHQQFLGPAVASVMYNVMIILFGVVLGKRLGIVGFSVGVTAGAATQFFIQVIGLRRIGMRYRPVFSWRHPGVRRIFALMVPVLLSYSLTQAGLFVQQNMTSSLPGGALAAVRWAQRLMQMPISIFAITLVTALYPTLTGQAARGEVDALKSSFTYGLRTIFYITMPCAIGLAVLSQPVVGLLYQRGNFTADDTVLTANTLVFFCLGLFAQGGVLLMNRVFYAMQDTWMPVIIGAGSMLLNIALNYLLIGRMGTGGLALAYSIAGLVSLVFLLVFTRRKIGAYGGKKLMASLAKTLGIALVMGAAVYAASSAVGTWLADSGGKSALAAQAGVGIVVGGLVYFGLSVFLKVEEVDTVKRMIRRMRHAS
ncbi:MAG: murein biosynthesis integral membrane protein MurJ [Clostridiales bacterium]|nr:murein biosynthesis integral membrane protein MurJ [Clostridiales bacterium]